MLNELRSAVAGIEPVKHGRAMILIMNGFDDGLNARRAMRKIFMRAQGREMDAQLKVVYDSRRKVEG
jgi:hypothetical protein